jgi:hypothetical protein
LGLAGYILNISQRPYRKVPRPVTEIRNRKVPRPVSEIRINGNVSAARLKVLDPARAEQAKQVLEAKRDGLDTYGLKTDAGDKLLVTTSSKPLTACDVVTIGGKQAQVNFVENEANNTFVERVEAIFQGKSYKIALGAGAGIAVIIATAIGISMGVTGPALWALGLSFWATVGAGVTAAGLTVVAPLMAGLTKVKIDESVTDALAPK